MEKRRNNGLDSLRILCMLLVTLSHVFSHGGRLSVRSLREASTGLRVTCCIRLRW